MISNGFLQENFGSRSIRHRLSDDGNVQHKTKSPPRSKKNEDCGDDPNVGLVKDRKLLRSQTAQGNLTESPKPSSSSSLHSISKSQSSSNLKSDSSENSITISSKRTEAQNFDRIIRVQHQNFVDKLDTNKEPSESGDVKNSRKKDDKVVLEPNGGGVMKETLVKSEKSVHLNSGGPDVKEKTTDFNVNDNINNLSIDAGINNTLCHLLTHQTKNKGREGREGGKKGGSISPIHSPPIKILFVFPFFPIF